jgi:hypothetical protein
MSLPPWLSPSHAAHAVTFALSVGLEEVAVQAYPVPALQPGSEVGVRSL